MSMPEQSQLGKKTQYIAHYQPELLFAIPRKVKRIEIGVNPEKLPFYGEDLWTGYELSWLNLDGKPEVAVIEFAVPCHSEFLIESKSIKLYFVSFSQTKFASWRDVAQTIAKDLSVASKSHVAVQLFTLGDYLKQRPMVTFDGVCLDNLNIAISDYCADSSLLQAGNQRATEVLYSDLLKSNCLVTGQPDWGSVQISYAGPKIDRESLLRYLIGFRLHQEFHEQCVERIFMDILERCQPEQLTVYARYTRRGGLDINPIRSSSLVTAPKIRLARQ